MSFYRELRRRNVFRAGVAYIVSSWIILQVADVVLGNINVPDWVFHVILFVLAIGFPVVLIFAWAFELTPEGIKREDEVETSGSAARDTGRKLDFAIIGLLVVAVGYFAYDKFVLSAAREATRIDSAPQAAAGREAGAASQSKKSIAVLPFANLSEDPKQEYFSDGLSEELLNLLAKIPALRVIARSSSFAYKGQQSNIEELSERLNVDHLLDGSVSKSGDTLRVYARLLLTEDGTTLWSSRYESGPDDVFAIQDDIASAVVNQLKIELLGAIPTSHKTDTEAYSLYLQARELSRQSTGEAHESAIELYNRALGIAPGYAAAWTGLAETYIFLAERSLRLPIDDTFRLASEAADAALQIDPDDALALASKGRIAMVHQNDLAAAARHLERALELDPTNPQIIRLAATLSMNLNRIDQATELLEYAAERDPVSSAVHANLGLNYFAAGRLDEAIDAYRTALRLSPNAVGLHSFLGEVLLANGDIDAALAHIEQESSEAWRLIALAMANHAAGKSTEADDNVDALIKQYGNEWPYNIAYVLAYRGNADAAFGWLDRAVDYNDPGLSEIVSAPEFENIWSDPRWLKFLESIGKAPNQLARIDFSVSRPR